MAKRKPKRGNPSKTQKAAVVDVEEREWSRFLPLAGDQVIEALGRLGPATKAQIAPHLGERDEDTGWSSSAVGEPEENFTDEELASLHQEFGWAGEAESAEEANADIAARHAHKQATLDRYAAALGVQPLRTAADVLDFLVACRLVLADPSAGGEDDQVRYALNPSPPRPEEVLAMSEQERAEQAERHRRNRYEPTAQAIIATFYFRRGRADSRRVTLQHLAREVSADVDHARAGVLYLISDGDFSANTDVEHVAEQEVFELAVDWKTFASSRISISS